jgi:hypothetical protein
MYNIRDVTVQLEPTNLQRHKTRKLEGLTMLPLLHNSAANTAIQRKCLKSPHYSTTTWQHCYEGLQWAIQHPHCAVRLQEKLGRSWVRQTMSLNAVINMEIKSGLPIRQTWWQCPLVGNSKLSVGTETFIQALWHYDTSFQTLAYSDTIYVTVFLRCKEHLLLPCPLASHANRSNSFWLLL